ncbi:MAG: TRAP transporter small permease [Thermodesulfobacteriota bacterium]
MPKNDVGRLRQESPLERVVVTVNRWIIIAMMAVMVVLVFMNVVCRYLLNFSIIWAEEISQYLMVWIAFIGAGLALREGRHVAIEILQDHMPSSAKKMTRHVVALLLIVFMVVLVVLGFQFSHFAWEQETPVLNIRLGIPYLAVPIGALLLAFHLFHLYRAYIDGRFETPESLEAKIDEDEVF